MMLGLLTEDLSQLGTAATAQLTGLPKKTLINRLPTFSFNFHRDIVSLKPKERVIEFRHAFDHGLDALGGRKRSTGCEGVHSHYDALGFKLKRASYIRGVEFERLFQ